ncbi:hypothetical protein [Amycolatopsis sp. lyj-23]|uniref:hypothetical protein n=1 Tax=Amycolatopsis sp. lyj-23 TaxID=2789283 RepID=UPI00397BB629
MAIDMGLGDPDAMQALAAAVSIVRESVDHLHDEIGEMPYSDDCEVYRLARALAPGPMSFDRSIIAAADSARGALDQIAYIIETNIPTSMIVLHALLRAALVGSGRIVFALLPADPEIRLQNARVLVTQESKSFTQALDRYVSFNQLSGLRPPSEYLQTAKQQNANLHDGHRAPGDGAVMEGTAKLVGEALALTPEYQDGHNELLREHVIWLWNTYSGMAHTYAWPRLLPGSSEDRRVPVDFPGDFYMIAATAHIATTDPDPRPAGTGNVFELLDAFADLRAAVEQAVDAGRFPAP